MTLDKHLTFNAHVGALCKSSHFHIRALRHIRSSLTKDMAKSIACTLVNSRLDYFNSLLYGVSSTNATRLQLVQNTLARVITGSGRREHITPTLKRFRWHPVKHRIDYKIAAMTFKASQIGEPAYLNSLITAYTPARSLRSAAFNRFATPSVTSCRTVIGSRAFSRCAPVIWNSLPSDITSSPSYDIFRNRLKTHCFNVAFGDSRHTFSMSLLVNLRTVRATDAIIYLFIFMLT